MCASGWPKNQKRCWNNNKSPPRKGSKKEELKWRSKIIIVIQPARTGTEIINKKEVKKIDQGNKGKNKEECKIERLQPFNKVAIELIEARTELTPAKWKEKNMKSIEEEFIVGRGTWKVRPELTPPSKNTAKSIKNKESRANQRLNAFNRGKIISEEQSIKGIKILPKPPIKIGIIIKKIIKIPWKVIIELYCNELSKT